MTTTLNPDAAWSRMTVDSLVDGGVWGVPRSGLLFTKRGENELALTARMPWEPGMPITAAQVREQQDSDYAAICLHMMVAGITVTDETKEDS